MSTEAEHIPPDEHVDADDPRYDGFRIRELWMATAVGSDNQEGLLYINEANAIKHHLLVGPAFAADERRLHHMRGFARAIAWEHNVEIRIRHYVLEGEAEVFPAGASG